MSESEVGVIHGRACAMFRFADALLRSLGATQITLRLAEPASGDTGSQLGLEPAQCEALQLGPAIVKQAEPASDGRKRVEIAVSATSVRKAAKSYGVEDVTSWLMSMQGVVVADQVLPIASVTSESFMGQEYLYHIIATQ